MMSQNNLCDDQFLTYIPHLFFFTFCTTCAPKNMSDQLSILKGEINRLGFVSEQKISLFTHFTENVEKIEVAVSCLEDLDEDEDKRTYLRSLISQPGNVSRDIR